MAELEAQAMLFIALEAVATYNLKCLIKDHACVSEAQRGDDYGIYLRSACPFVGAGGYQSLFHL
jgi:hypothetical protein